MGLKNNQIKERQTEKYSVIFKFSKSYYVYKYTNSIFHLLWPIPLCNSSGNYHVLDAADKLNTPICYETIEEKRYVYYDVLFVVKVSAHQFCQRTSSGDI